MAALDETIPTEALFIACTKVRRRGAAAPTSLRHMLGSKHSQSQQTAVSKSEHVNGHPLLSLRIPERSSLGDMSTPKWDSKLLVTRFSRSCIPF